MRLSRVLVLAFLSLLAVGCSGDDTEPDGSMSPTANASSHGAAGGLVTGAGADVPPEDPAAWCAAVTPEQLTEATGFTVDSVIPSTTVSGDLSCIAELPGVELQIVWYFKDSNETPEKYLASLKNPAGVFDVAPVELPSGAAGASATAETPVQARVGVIHDGGLVEATLSVVMPGDDTPTSAALAAVAEDLVAVYAG